MRKDLATTPRSKIHKLDLHFVDLIELKCWWVESCRYHWLIYLILVLLICDLCLKVVKFSRFFLQVIKVSCGGDNFANQRHFLIMAVLCIRQKQTTTITIILLEDYLRANCRYVSFAVFSLPLKPFFSLLYLLYL